MGLATIMGKRVNVERAGQNFSFTSSETNAAHLLKGDMQALGVPTTAVHDGFTVSESSLLHGEMDNSVYRAVLSATSEQERC